MNTLDKIINDLQAGKMEYEFKISRSTIEANELKRLIIEVAFWKEVLDSIYHREPHSFKDEQKQFERLFIEAQHKIHKQLHDKTLPIL